ARDDAVRDELERRPLPRRQAFGQPRLRVVDDLERSPARLVQRPGRLDAVADALGGLGVADRPRVERGELRVAFAGEDVRERDGAVEQVGAAVLARPRSRPGHVEDVVEELEGEADATAEVAEGEGVAADLERSQTA